MKRDNWSAEKIGDLIEPCWPGEWGQNVTDDSKAILVYRSTELDNDGHLIESGGVYREIDSTIYARKGLKNGDVLLEASGGTPGRAVGRVGLFSGARHEKAMCANFLRVLRPNSKIVPSYLHWQLIQLHKSSEIWKFQQQTTGMSNLKVSNYLCHKIPVPNEIFEQRRIAEILSTIDEAIEHTEALIAKHQQIKAGLMHDLFTRGVLPNGQLRPSRDDAPKLYKQSELGWIPKEWEVETLERRLMGPPKNGYSPQEADSYTGIKMLGLGCLTARGFQPNQIKDAPASDAKVSSALIDEGDLLISRANTRELVGLVGLFKSIGLPCSYPDLMMRLKPNVDTDPSYLELLLRSPLIRRQIKAQAVGTSSSMVKISGAIVRRLNVFVPDMPEQKLIVDASLMIENEIEHSQHRLRKLELQKSGLMQDLLTGKVRVPQGETT